MDLFKFGLRSVLGMTMPGAILVLVFLYTLFSVMFSLNHPLAFVSQGKDQQFLILATLFLASYVLGSLMRLNAADSVDEKSAKYCLNKYYKEKASLNRKPVKTLARGLARPFQAWKWTRKAWKWTRRRGRKPGLELTYWNRFAPIFIPKLIYRYFSAQSLNRRFKKVKMQPHGGASKNTELLEDSDAWIWMKEEFPYPIWQFRKLHRYHPNEVFRFFESYAPCMGIGHGWQGKEFFNYCKMVIYHASRQLGDAVVEEVHLAEALVRFYAGTYYGLWISLYMLVASSITQGIVLLRQEWEPSTPIFKILNLVVTIFLVAAVYLSQDMIVQRFRTLRLKEVDTVYDAFYLIHRHVDTCSICSPDSTILSRERH